VQFVIAGQAMFPEYFMRLEKTPQEFACSDVAKAGA